MTDTSHPRLTAAEPAADRSRSEATVAPAAGAAGPSGPLPRVEQRSGVGANALARKGVVDRILDTPGAGRTQSMRGFDPEYVDIVDYIVRCTHRIWEEQAVGLIYTHYAHNSVVHTGDETTYGREQVVANTLASLASIPDRKLYADDVIWAGDDEAGFHTSHHLTEVGHNTGHSAYGPPTGRRVVYRAIANCFVRENMILEEWLLGDDITFLRQLGIDPRKVARRRARAILRHGPPATPVGPVQRGVGQRMPDALPPGVSTDVPVGDFDPEDFVRRAYHEVWNRRMLNRLRDLCAPHFRCRTASGRRFVGTDDYAAFILSILAAFPDAKMTLEHVYWNGDDAEGYRVAVRWALTGTHEGPGEWGQPSGARVRVMGLSHLRIEGGRLVEESTLFDELGLLTQLWTTRLATGPT